MIISKRVVSVDRWPKLPRGDPWKQGRDALRDAWTTCWTTTANSELHLLTHEWTIEQWLEVFALVHLAQHPDVVILVQMYRLTTVNNLLVVFVMAFWCLLQNIFTPRKGHLWLLTHVSIHGVPRWNPAFQYWWKQIKIPRMLKMIKRENIGNAQQAEQQKERVNVSSQRLFIRTWNSQSEEGSQFKMSPIQVLHGCWLTHQVTPVFCD